MRELLGLPRTSGLAYTRSQRMAAPHHISSSLESRTSFTLRCANLLLLLKV